MCHDHSRFCFFRQPLSYKRQSAEMSQYLKVIAEVLQYNEAALAETSKFQRWAHNEHLCPAVERQLNVVRNSFFKYQSDAYEFQGPRDEGTDVLLRYRTGIDDEDTRYIAFQVKSFGDLRAKDYLKELRSQYTMAVSEYADKLDRYYVLLCTDVKKHDSKIKNIKKAFSKLEKATVISPGYVLTFLRLRELQAGFVVESILSDEDEVHKQARDVVAGLSPTQAGILLKATLDCLVNFRTDFDPEDLKGDMFLRDLYSRTPDYDSRDYDLLEGRVAAEVEFADDSDDLESDDDDDYYFEDDEWTDREPEDRERPFEVRLAEDVEALTERLFSVDGVSGRFHLEPAYSRSVQAVLLDNMVRYAYAGEELLTFVLGALQVMERYGIYDMGNEEDELLP